MNNAGRELRNGVRLPQIGFGSYRLEDPRLTVKTVVQAIECGYRLIDTAACYKNEESVGEAVRSCEIPRNELIVTSKVWNTERGYEKTLAAFEESRKKLGLEYLDLYLIHWPANALSDSDWEDVNRSTWRALQTLYKDGSVRAIGVSNFQPKHLLALMEEEVQPMVNQIELHPGFLQKDTVDYCAAHGIVTQAWAPLGKGTLLEHPLLTSLAEKYDCSPAQVCLGWEVRHGVIPLPKSAHPERMRQNLAPCTLSEEDMLKIDALAPCGGSCTDSDLVDFK